MFFPCALVCIFFNSIFQSLMPVSTKGSTANHSEYQNLLFLKEEIFIRIKESELIRSVVEK